MQKDDLNKLYRNYKTSIEKDKERAKELIKDGNKNLALLFLKKKRFYETKMDYIQQHIVQIDLLSREIEMAQLNQGIYEMLKQGNEALKTLNQSISIEDVEMILNETSEAAEKQEEISAMISGQLTDKDLTEVQHEFDVLVKNQLPEVPTEELPQPESSRIRTEDNVGRKKKVVLEEF
uniref:Charged multivesicular body protein 6 n=1 Tax=Acrobeloides nanus TaxID=290746 RepID=A0A914E4U4_9BILA